MAIKQNSWKTPVSTTSPPYLAGVHQQAQASACAAAAHMPPRSVKPAEQDAPPPWVLFKGPKRLMAELRGLQRPGATCPLRCLHACLLPTACCAGRGLAREGDPDLHLPLLCAPPHPTTGLIPYPNPTSPHRWAHLTAHLIPYPNPTSPHCWAHLT